MSHPHISVRTYVTVYVILLALTALTTGLAIGVKLGAWELPVALGIASTKTLLVGWYFMHLKYASKLIWLILGAGVLFFLILIGLVLADYMTRGWFPWGPQQKLPPLSGWLWF